MNCVNFFDTSVIGYFWNFVDLFLSHARIFIDWCCFSLSFDAESSVKKLNYDYFRDKTVITLSNIQQPTPAEKNSQRARRVHVFNQVV